MAIEERAREYYTLFSERKMKELEALFTDDSIIIDFRGVEHHSTGVVRMFELYPAGAKFEPLSLAVDDRSVYTTFRVTGGPAGRAAEGKDFFVFYGDKIRVLKTVLPPS
ncbi:MAG TPA: nuclear transport factor 2 family protein [Thermoanaerobaculia bacterium]|nr:nuclear transport factor 2 family protein [Thermoanaerobaculia bacterium]